MRLHVDTAIGIGSLLAVQLLSSFAAVGLLSRTSPAAERILREDASIAATEQMLAVLAIGAERSAFEAGLAEARLRQNNPEEEGPILDRIGALTPRIYAGEPEARSEAVVLLREYAATNRASMQELDERARFLGRAGAWTSAFLGGFGFLLSIVVYRRLRERVEEPILELDHTLLAVRGGEPRRRASTHLGPDETRRIAENVNWLLDRLELARPVTTEEQRSDRALLVAVLDRWPEPALVLDDHGRTVARNKAAVGLWDAPDDPVPALANAIRTEAPAPAGWTVERLESAEAWFVRRT